MDTKYYLTKFNNAASQLDKKLLAKKQLESTVGVVLNSVFLKLYKTSWASQGEDPLTANSRIFFSIWVNDATIAEQKLCYNIHAFKLRQLKGYKIESRKFAEHFRMEFTLFKHNWPNVKTDFGPLTLMEGWLPLNNENLERDIVNLAQCFLQIEHLIDDTLIRFSK